MDEKSARSEIESFEGNLRNFKLCAKIGDNKYHLRTYKQCFIGNKTVDTLVANGAARDRAEAVEIGNHMMELGVIQHVTKGHTFEDKPLFYRFTISDSYLNPIAKDFWNVRGNFEVKLPGIKIPVGTHMSIIRRSNGKYIVLDVVDLNDSFKRQLDGMTNNGKDIEAVLLLHSFHTLALPGFFKEYPNLDYYGCPRHIKKFPEIEWKGNLIDCETRQRFAPDLAMSIPVGCEFENPKPPGSNHLSSVLVLHRPSKTMHVDDTFNYWINPTLLMRIAGNKPCTMTLHMSITKLDDRQAFKAWLIDLLDKWDFANMCTAHNANCIGVAREKLVALLEKSTPFLDGKANMEPAELMSGDTGLTDVRCECG